MFLLLNVEEFQVSQVSPYITARVHQPCPEMCRAYTGVCVCGGGEVGGVVAKNKMADLRRPRIWISS